MTNWQNVIGHEWAVQMLSQAIANGRLGHAYLITGPDHVGKTTLARTFAQALNCEAETIVKRPCGECRTCHLIALGRHPDIRVVEPEVSGRGKLTLKIDEIRQLQHDLNLSAYEAKVKVAILRRFDAATAGAANAFLKTLEEPPSKVMLILTATDADDMLPTISSRCRTINLRPLPTDLIEQSLAVRWQLKADNAYLLAHLADGRLGWAVQAAADTTVIENRRTHLAALYDALNGSRVARFDLADRLARRPDTLPEVLQNWLSWWRDATMLAQQNGQTQKQVPITNVDQSEQLRAWAGTWQKEIVLSSIKQTNLALWQLEHNANTRLVLENLLLTYPLPP